MLVVELCLCAWGSTSFELYKNIVVQVFLVASVERTSSHRDIVGRDIGLVLVA